MNENRRVRTFDIYCLSKFKVCNTLLTTVTMLCRFPELLHVVKGSLYPLVNISTFPSPPYSPASGNHHFHYTTMNLTFFLYSTYKISWNIYLSGLALFNLAGYYFSFLSVVKNSRIFHNTQKIGNYGKQHYVT